VIFTLSVVLNALRVIVQLPAAGALIAVTVNDVPAVGEIVANVLQLLAPVMVTLLPNDPV